jgi:ADP-ribose pyrophosphatase YjhB (NUDIX family)
MIGIIDKDTLDLVTSSKMTSGNNWGTGVILYNPQTRKILLAERTDTHNFGGPGGKVELGESPMQGVMRECKEESNLTVDNLMFYGYHCHTAPNGKNWTDFLFISTAWHGELKNQESEMMEWKEYDVYEVDFMDLFPPCAFSLRVAMEHNLFEKLSAKEVDANGFFADSAIKAAKSAPGIAMPDMDVCSYSHQDGMVGIL